MFIIIWHDIMILLNKTVEIYCSVIFVIFNDIFYNNEN